jgi:hypothetical protein
MTPLGLQFHAAQPIMTAQAACSEHRRHDMLPMHPELAAMVSESIAGMEEISLSSRGGNVRRTG